MSILNKLPFSCSKKSRTVASILDSFKRHYGKIDPASIDKSFDHDSVELHSKLAAQWWDPRRNPLHALNEIRVPFITNCVSNSGVIHSADSNRDSLLEGLNVLDVGCGGGILSEALGRLRCNVVGIDASAELIKVAKNHAARDKNVEKHVKYENADLSTYAKQHSQAFDLVVVSEVLEHVSNKDYFLKLCAECLKDRGSLFITTPNRTILSKLLLVQLSEFLSIVPFGTHDYDKFIQPHELALKLLDLNCVTTHIEGIMFWPFSRKFEAHRHTIFMYALHAIKNVDLPQNDVLGQDKIVGFCS